MNSIAAIVVTYNRKELLLRCIDHLLKQEDITPDILIIDNASTDGTQDALFPFIDNEKIQYFNTCENLGGAGGFNYGLKKAYARGYAYYWLMDDDTLPEPDALSKLLQVNDALKGNYGFLSSAAYWKDGSLCNMNIQRRTAFRKQADFSSPYSPITMATFVSFFLKKETLEAFGLPIKEFFIWSDDMEYSRRISRKRSCYLVPGSRVIHWMNSNAKVGIEQDSDDRLWRYQYMYRNEVYVYRREGIKGWLYLAARMLLHSLRIIKNGKKQRYNRLIIVWKSFFKGISFHPLVEKIC